MAIPVIIIWWVVGGLTRKQRGDSAGKKHGTQGPVDDTKRTYSLGGPVDSVLICGLILLLLNLIFYSTIGWLPTYLTEGGWDGTSAATATSVISFLEIPAVLLIPMLSDRIGRRRLILFLSFSLISLCSAALALGASSGWFVAPVLGITFGGTFALLLVMPVELVEREKVASAAGAVLSIGYVGALTGPLITGYLRDLTGSFVMGFLLMASAGLVSIVLSCILPRRPTPALPHLGP
jgi:CP family cyanate transporter-like MFS transporter